MFGKTGFASKHATKKLLKFLDKINPDIVHLHNIHGYYLNIELLFNYLKEKQIRVIWTLHDCWSFTGQCAFFDYVGCDKWQTECKNCPMLSEYPKSFVDSSKWNYQKKKELFTGLNITLVTPSKWLASLVKNSYLKVYDVKVINNGIDLNVFKPTPSNFREKYCLKDKKMILGVAGVWDRRKGLNDFIELSKLLDDNYVIVLVGLNDKQLDLLPHNIIGIKRTENQQELAGLYTTADVFFNPTYEDNYPTVNLESLACGTPVITYDTGGSPEFVDFFDSHYHPVISKAKLCDEDFNYIVDNINNCMRQKRIINLIDKKKLHFSNMVSAYIEIYKSLR